MTKLGDYTKPLEQQAKDLGYDSIEDALKDKNVVITAVPTGEYKDFRLEVDDGKITIGSLRFQDTFVSLRDYKNRKSDLEKFREFFANYGIKIRHDAEDAYYMSGDKVDITVREGSDWRFDKDGNFIKVIEGS